MDGGTKYVSWETYYGPGALAVLALKKQLNAQFEVQVSRLYIFSSSRVYCRLSLV